MPQKVPQRLLQEAWSPRRLSVCCTERHQNVTVDTGARDQAENKDVTTFLREATEEWLRKARKCRLGSHSYLPIPLDPD
jgi:hypothetical protein